MLSSNDLAAKFNYLKKPGYHSMLSPVVGTRSDELKEVQSHPELIGFEKIIYKSEYIYLIPKDKREKANAIASELFSEYIKKYEKFGVTEENIVDFSKTELPGAASNKTFLNDVENEWNTWWLNLVIEAENGIHNEKSNCYLPPYIVAYHEVMHAEETPKGVRQSFQQQPGGEILTATKTIILLDYVYKKINDIPLNEIVDYKKDIWIGEKTVQLGYIANFYRNLEDKHGSLAKALVSESSLQFLAGIKTANKKQESFGFLKTSPEQIFGFRDEDLSWMQSIGKGDHLSLSSVENDSESTGTITKLLSEYKKYGYDNTIAVGINDGLDTEREKTSFDSLNEVSKSLKDHDRHNVSGIPRPVKPLSVKWLFDGHGSSDIHAALEAKTNMRSSQADIKIT